MKISSPRSNPAGRPSAVRTAGQSVTRAGKMLMLHRQLQDVSHATTVRRRKTK